MALTGSTKIIVIVAVVVVVVAAIAGAFIVMNSGKDEKTLTIATSPDFPNFEYMYGKEFAGIDMDIIRAICNDLGYKPEFKNVIFGGIVTGVSEGKYDVGASGISYDPERAKSVLYSDMYISSSQVVLTKTEVILVEEQLEGKKLGVQLGTTGDLYVTDYYAADKITRYNTYSDAVQSLINGKIDCLVMDEGPAKVFAENNNLILNDPDLSADKDEYGFIFKLDNKSLQEEFNKSIAKLTADGTIEKIILYYQDAKGDIPSYYSKSRIGIAATGSQSVQSFDGGVTLPLSSSASPAMDEKGSIIDDIKRAFLDNDRYQYIVEGLKNTLIITALALVLGLLLGIILAVIRSVHDLLGKLKILNAIAKVYITVIRGTPVVVQLLIIYFVIFATSNLNIIIVASIAFGCNSAAYVAEIMRAGINAVPRGQMEAASSLGLPFISIMVLVILPQAFRNILPALCNEGITLLKETSISGYIGVMDLTRAGDLIRSQTFQALVPLVGVAMIYLIIVLILTYLVSKLEKRLNAHAI